ncbi:hypothetical protein CapIbe_013570 [Capra ibex]
MVRVSGALFNEPSTGVPALLTTVGSSSANAEDAGSIGRRNNCFIFRSFIHSSRAASNMHANRLSSSCFC